MSTVDEAADGPRPNLGLATTAELARELETRIRLGNGDPDYRTVDEPPTTEHYWVHPGDKVTLNPPNGPETTFTMAEDGTLEDAPLSTQERVGPYLLDDRTKQDLAAMEPKSALNSLLVQLAGAASMCWESMPPGVFESTRAVKLVDEVSEYIWSKWTPRLTLGGVFHKDWGMKAADWSNAMSIGVEAPYPPRYSVELISRSFDIYANGLNVGRVQRSINDTWQVELGRRGALAEVICGKLDSRRTPDTDRLSTSDIEIKFINPDLTVPEDEDDDEWAADSPE